MNNELEPPEEKGVKEPLWIVNSLGELGVCIGGRFFFLYKGRSLEYEQRRDFTTDEPILWRPVGKREFGETCHPTRYYDAQGNCLFPDTYDAPLLPGIGWNGDPSELEWKPLHESLNNEPAKTP